MNKMTAAVSSDECVDRLMKSLCIVISLFPPFPVWGGGGVDKKHTKCYRPVALGGVLTMVGNGHSFFPQ